MRGSVLLTLTLSILLLGATSASAQNHASLVVDQTPEQQTEVTAPSEAHGTVSSVVLAQPPHTPITTRHGIQAAMLDVSAQNGDEPSAELDDRGRRNLLYIVGGTLVAGGITAAIILLTGGDDDGIPAPPGRPGQ